MLKKLLRKLGLIKSLPLSNPGGRPKHEITLTEIMEDKKSGLSNRQIAKKRNISEGTVRSRLKNSQ